MSKSEFIKTIVNLHIDEIEIIKKMSNKYMITKTEIIRSAIHNSYLLQLITNNNGKILIERIDGSLMELVYK